MTSIVSEYVIQIMPIFAGIAFVLLIRLTAAKEDTLVIRSAAHTSAKSLQTDMVFDTRSFELPVPLSELGDSEYMQNAFVAMNAQPQGSKLRAWHGYVGTSERMRDSVFDRLAYDSLVVEGNVPRNKSAHSIREYAAEKLGFVDLDSLRSAARHGHARLRVYAPDKRALLARIIWFGADSGLLLHNLAGYGLDIEEV